MYQGQEAGSNLTGGERGGRPGTSTKLKQKSWILLRYLLLWNYEEFVKVSIDEVWIGRWIFGHLHLVTASSNNSLWIYTAYSSLWHAGRLLSLLCLHHFSGNSCQRRTFLFFWVPVLSACLSHNSRLTDQTTNAQQQQKLLLVLLQLLLLLLPLLPLLLLLLLLLFHIESLTQEGSHKICARNHLEKTISWWHFYFCERDCFVVTASVV
jgi:hypothetical protein